MKSSHRSKRLIIVEPIAGLAIQSRVIKALDNVNPYVNALRSPLSLKKNRENQKLFFREIEIKPLCLSIILGRLNAQLFYSSW